MSASYTLHVAPYATPGDPHALDRANLVRDGFTWWAFLVPPVWFLAHRHWLVSLGLLVLLAGFWVGLRALGLPSGVAIVLNGLLWLLVGLEASSLRRWDYARQGRPTVDVVFAANEAEAEAKSFARWLGPAEATPPPLPPTGETARRLARPWRAPERSPVIGLVPDVEGRR